MNFIELDRTYDSFIDSLVHLLALRDAETEEHTWRVTLITLDLIRIFNIPKSEWQHIRRGALLHDIGKIGIPDKILLKEGTLTDVEIAIMRKHPEYALDLIGFFPQLEKALEIPYCHHEKWDGSGYPRGLKEFEIPISARIFALVDVWDALLTNRPYRSAWRIENVNEYIYTQSGKHFDPEMVPVFLKLIDNFNSVSPELSYKTTSSGDQQRPAKWIHEQSENSESHIPNLYNLGDN